MYKTAVIAQFLEAFRHLPRNIQGRVLDFVEKFQRDPQLPGINYESIVGARDKKLHSVRIDDKYRAIVLKPKQGNIYRLVWVAKHDDAYSWARNRVFREDDAGTHCALVVENVDVLERHVHGPVNVGGPGLFDHVSDSDFHAIGVPAEAIQLLREIRTVEVLVALRGAVAAHVLYALECLARNDDKGAVIEYVTEESKRIANESLALGDGCSLQTSSSDFMLRDVLSRLMATESSPRQDETTTIREMQPPTGHQDPSLVAASAVSAMRLAEGESIDDGLLEEAIRKYREDLREWVAKQAKGRQRVALTAAAQKNRESNPEDAASDIPDGEVVPMLRFLADRSQCVLVSSEGGSGKSTTMQMVAASWANEYCPGNRVYVFATLRDFRGERTKDILEYVSSPDAAFGEVPLLSEVSVRRLAVSGRLVLLLDGRDEIEGNSRATFARVLASGRRQKLFAAAVVSSRESSAPQDIYDWKVNISPLAEDEQLSLVRSYIPEEERAAEFLADIRSEAGGREIADSPLCLSLACEMEVDSSRKRTANRGWAGRAHLYRRFWDHLQEREEDKLRDEFGNHNSLQFRVALGEVFAKALTDRRAQHVDEFLKAIGSEKVEGLASAKPIIARMVLDRPPAEDRSSASVAPAVQQVIAGLRGVCPMPEKVCDVLQKWPLFTLRTDNCFAACHKTWYEFLIAEYLLANPVSGERVASALSRDDRFLLRCVFELAEDGYWRDPRGDAANLLRALHGVDPLFVAMSLRGDGAADALKQCLDRDRTPLRDDPWRRGVQQVMAGVSARECTERIVEEDLSYPSQGIADELANQEFWWAARVCRDVYQRLENLWYLCHSEPEPWADLLRYCVVGFPEWRQRIEYLASFDPDVAVRARFRCLAHLLRVYNLGDGGELPTINENGEAAGEWFGLSCDLISPRLLLNCCLSDCSSYLQLSPDVGRNQAAASGQGASTGAAQQPAYSFTAGHVLWVLCSSPQFWLSGGGDGFSRRQWNHVWRLWDATDGGWSSVSARDVAAAAAALRSGLPTPISAAVDYDCPNEACAAIRFGVVHVEDIPDEAVRRWARSCAAIECRALMLAGVSLDKYESERALFIRLAEDVEQRRLLQAYIPDDVGEFLRFWCARGCSVDWLQRSLLERMLEPVFDFSLFCYWQWDLFDDECICWDHLPASRREEIALECVRRLLSVDGRLPHHPIQFLGQESGDEILVPPDIIPSLVVQDRVMAEFYLVQVVKAIGSGRLGWGELNPWETLLITREGAQVIVKQCVEHGVLPIDILAIAPDTIRTLSTVASALSRQSDVRAEHNERRREALGLVVLKSQQALKGGMSGSQVTRVFYRLPDEVLKLGVMKTTADPHDFRRESSGASLAASSWMAESGRAWIPTIPLKGELQQRVVGEPADEGQSHEISRIVEYLLLSPLAFPPDKASLHVSSIHEIIERGERAAAMMIVSHLGSEYACRLKEIVDRGGEHCVAASFEGHVNRLLHTRWPKLSLADQAKDGLSPQMKRLLEVPAIIDLDGVVRRNPLWCLQSDEREATAIDLLPVDFCHGDLNTRNILAPATGDSRAPILQMIDFEKAGDYIASLDSCWLSFWLVMASEPDPKIDAPLWNRLPESMLSAMRGLPQVPEYCGSYQLGLDLVRELFRPWRELDEGRATALGPIAERTLLVGALGCALAKSLLHDRDLERRRNRGESDSAADRADIAWRAAFFRLAALTLELVQGGSTVREPSVSIRSLLDTVQ